ncbi:MAG: bacillithiol system redox-active protein YtxJ [Bacteroidia bacterium]
MGWQRLEQFPQLGGIVQASSKRPQLVFKHSTRCSISAAAKYKLEMDLDALGEHYDLHFLDLLANRDLSRMVAERFDVVHQSPQVLVIKGGRATYVASHYDIDGGELLKLEASASRAGSH